MAYVRWSLALLALAAALVLLTFGDYGVTWDEELHVRYGNGVLDFRGRDRPYGRPPAQIPASAANALGSYLRS